MGSVANQKQFAMMSNICSVCFFLIAVFVSVPTFSQKLPPPGFVNPVCKNPPCNLKKIRAKIYIEDSLWDQMSSAVAGGNPTNEIDQQLSKIFEGVNEHLENLDNGGFKVEYEDVVKLGQSDIVLQNTYVDRINGNKTTKVDPNNIFSHTFTFQEAVQKLTDRNSVDIRILMIKEVRGGPDLTLATSEETCICNPAWFGCVGIFSIRYLGQWAYHKNVFAHELGHTLGMDVHDDQFYNSNPQDKLLMWSSVGFDANVWSPAAKTRINRQDNSCLAVVREKDSSAILFPDD